MKRYMIRAVGLVLAVVLAVGGFMAIRTQLEYAQEETSRSEAAELAELPPHFQPYEQEEAAADEPDPNLVLLAQMNLEGLQEENPDVVGWICIPDTELSYPLVQGKDNAYYLKHTWQRTKNPGGAIFLEQTSNADFTDYHTIVYGHRMRNDSMFGTLKYYKDLDFWREHPCIYVVTADGAYRYDIFAAQEAGIKDIVYRLDIEEKHLEEEFLQYCTAGSAIDTGLTPMTDDRILTLSTCTGGSHATRWVVHGARTQVYERPKTDLPE